jgi:hypothetical protein
MALSSVFRLAAGLLLLYGSTSMAAELRESRPLCDKRADGRPLLSTRARAGGGFPRQHFAD